MTQAQGASCPVDELPPGMSCPVDELPPGMQYPRVCLASLELDSVLRSAHCLTVQRILPPLPQPTWIAHANEYVYARASQSRCTIRVCVFGIS